MHNITVSAIGQADDTAILSNSPHSLQNLLQLSINFCEKNRVQLCVEKTCLQVLCTQSMRDWVRHDKLSSPINIDGKILDFVELAEHVRIIRSSQNNFSNITASLTTIKH